MTSFKVLKATIPGAGKQAPTTTAIEFPEAFVMAATKKAVQLRIPAINKTEWLAKSQLCGEAEDGSLPGIDHLSRVGEVGSVRVPKFIASRWLAPHLYAKG